MQEESKNQGNAAVAGLKAPFQVLSFDGGGIKGLFSVAILAALERDLNVRVADHFDLIAGTSTGGIIALALGAGKSPAEIVQFYMNEGPNIFRRGPLNNIRSFFASKYDPQALEYALKNSFGDALLGSSRKRLLVPSYDLDSDNIHIFKTRHHEKLSRDHRHPFWKIALATSAAPTYFPAFRGIDHVRLIDGGVWANNPAVLAIIEANRALNVPFERMRLFSLGTTDPVTRRERNLDRGGKWHWREQAISIVLRAQSVGAHAQTVHILGDENVCRVEPRVADGLFDLDKLNLEDLMSRAASESRSISPVFGRMFKEHIAPNFNPIP